MKEQAPEAFVKGIIRKTLFVALGLALALVALGYPSWAKGLALGALASTVNFYLMALFLPRLLGVKRRRAEVMSLLSLVVRFGVMGIALAISLFFPKTIEVFACVPGLFAVQLCLVVYHFLPKRLVAKASGSE